MREVSHVHYDLLVQMSHENLNFVCKEALPDLLMRTGRADVFLLALRVSQKLFDPLGSFFWKLQYPGGKEEKRRYYLRCLNKVPLSTRLISLLRTDVQRTHDPVLAAVNSYDI